MGQTKSRRIVDALDDLVTEMRTANALSALQLPGGALDHDPGDRAKTDVTRARVAHSNRLRALVRDGLNLGEE